MGYDFEQFSPDRFQDFCSALLLYEYPDMQSFPVGQKDGGRDGLAGPSADAKVFQVKFRRQLLANEDYLKWLQNSIRAELPKIHRLAARGATSYLLVTNVPGTSALDVGTMDRMQKFIDETLPIPGKVWWRQDITSRLHKAYDLKWEFSEVVTSRDMQRMILTGQSTNEHKRRTKILNKYLARQYDDDSEVKFTQVGLQDINLLDLFIDVPCSLVATDGPFGNVRAVESDAASLRHRGHEMGGTASFLLHAKLHPKLIRIVLEGAPGQGKSTLTQYLCQVHRMRLLDKDDLNQLPERHRSMPVRTPFKVDLRDFAKWLSTGSRDLATLEAFLADQVSRASGGQSFTVDDLAETVETVPCIIVLDGLDEVASLSERGRVIEEIDEAATRLVLSAKSARFVVTSRPAAIPNAPKFPHTWSRLRLSAIGEDLIFEYITRWGRARKIKPSDLTNIEEIVREKMGSPHIAHLSRNPMQLTILLNLVQLRGRSLPDQRTQLYDSYIDVFFDRESEKSEVVRDNRDLLLSLHGYVAWKIHSSAEAEKSSGRVTVPELNDMIRAYLELRGHDPSAFDALFTGSAQRVVALTSRVEGTYEFEVQPLREYFAARHLYDTAPHSPPGNPQPGTAPEIFAGIGPNPYWLNVTRFYAGCYSVGELAGLADQISGLVSSGPDQYCSYPRVLATSLLSDRVFHQDLRVTARLADTAIDSLTVRANTTGRFSADDTGPTLDLPAGCGQKESGTRLKELIQSASNAEFALDAAAALRAMQLPETKAWWIQKMSEAPDTDIDLWLGLGARLGSIATLGRSEVEPLVSRFGDTFRSRLMEWGAAFLVASAEEERELVANAIDGRSRLTSLPVDYGLLNSSLSPYRLQVLLSHRRIFGFTSGDEGATSQFHDPNVTHAIRSIAALFREERPWDKSLTPWADLSGIVENLAGANTWSSFVIANTAASISSASERGRGANSLIDSSYSMPSRARNARMRKSAVDWWRRQFDDCREAGMQRGWLLLVLTRGSSATVLACLDLIDRAISEMSNIELESLADACEDQFLQMNREGDTLPPVRVLKRKCSAVTMAMLSFRATNTWRSDFAASLPREVAKDLPVLAEIALRWITSPHIIEEWFTKSRLERSRDLLCLGNGMLRRFFWWDSSPAAYLAPATARKILRDAGSYPARFVSASDFLLSSLEQQERAAVADIARASGWKAG